MSIKEDNDVELEKYICSHAENCMHSTCIHRVAHLKTSSCHIDKCWWNNVNKDRKCQKV